jgi:hypothetical protein
MSLSLLDWRRVAPPVRRHRSADDVAARMSCGITQTARLNPDSPITPADARTSPGFLSPFRRRLFEFEVEVDVDVEARTSTSPPVRMASSRSTASV